MNYIDLLLDVLKSEQKLKLSTYNDYLDSALDSIPGSALVDFELLEIVETYFEPSSEEERSSILTSIAKYMNLMQLNSNGTIVTIYSQIEAVLLYKINETGKLEDFKMKQRSLDGSYIAKMCSYIADNLYTLNHKEQQILSLLDNEIRPIRNKIAHEPADFIDFENVNLFVGDGRSLESKLNSHHKVHEQFITKLHNIAVVFFEMCRKF
ncbi:hypothetical protein AAXB25_07000 [Paenibacillus lautus]|uniref:hypothetical protein n=1 Tax=Paenibacillus lautus TaxID=1401 RepID=UPI003D28CB1F